ncbi:MAG: YfiT family bacillithiol transferase [Bryobacteraceae bacterium]
MDELRFPVGKFEPPKQPFLEVRDSFIDEIARAPQAYRDAVRGLDDSQLDTEYRPGGWTVRQVIHHVADSHLNAYTRTRLALTESEPAIKGYEEKLWAELPDARTEPVEVSLTLLESLHHRWVKLLRSLSTSDFGRTFRHPELGLMNLEAQVALYAWHSRHHAAHINRLRDRMGWR